MVCLRMANDRKDNFQSSSIGLIDDHTSRSRLVPALPEVSASWTCCLDVAEPSLGQSRTEHLLIIVQDRENAKVRKMAKAVDQMVAARSETSH
jgi:hypothetical protein